MKLYLYRAVATEEILPEHEWQNGIAEGETLGGRNSGYLSRSSAVAAGKNSGVTHRIERSNPITFGPQTVTAEQREQATQARLGAALAELVLAGNVTAAAAVAQEIAR